MNAPPDEARLLFAEAIRLHDAREFTKSIDFARRALDLDPAYAEALEHLATLLITRRGAYTEGLAFIDRAAAARPDDAGLWYAAGWCYEFAAHEIRRHPTGIDLDAKALYTHAADAFRRCLALRPDGKLVGDAADLLDHVENELRSL